MRTTKLIALVLFIVAAVVFGAGVLGVIKGPIELLGLCLAASGLAFDTL